MIITDQLWKEVNNEFPNVSMTFTTAIKLLRQEITGISVELNKDSLYICHDGSNVLGWVGNSDEYFEMATSCLMAMRYGSILKEHEMK